MTVAELASTIAHIDGVAPRRGAKMEDIRAAELRLGVPMPAELRELVTVMDGCDGETPSSQGWTRLWPTREWRKVADSGSTRQFAHAIVFADYGQESWWYAFESAPEGVVRAAKINGLDCVVSDSLP